MSDLIRLDFHTVSSTWMHPASPPVTPYRRVIGMSSEVGTARARFVVDKLVATVTHLVTLQLAKNAIAFFNEHIAGHDPEHPDSPEQQAVRSGRDHAGPGRYTCHVFAMRMLDRPSSANILTAGLDALDLKEGYTRIIGNLAMLRHGVVVDSYTDALLHSTIGLGDDVLTSLQVINTNSNMALLPYDVLLHGLPSVGACEIRA